MWYIYSCCLSQDLRAKRRAAGERLSSSNKDGTTVSEDGTLWATQEEGKMPQGLRFAFPCYMETREKNGNTVEGHQTPKAKLITRDRRVKNVYN